MTKMLNWISNQWTINSSWLIDYWLIFLALYLGVWSNLAAVSKSENWLNSKFTDDFSVDAMPTQTNHSLPTQSVYPPWHSTETTTRLQVLVLLLAHINECDRCGQHMHKQTTETSHVNLYQLYSCWLSGQQWTSHATASWEGCLVASDPNLPLLPSTAADHAYHWFNSVRTNYYYYYYAHVPSLSNKIVDVLEGSIADKSFTRQHFFNDVKWRFGG